MNAYEAIAREAAMIHAATRKIKAAHQAERDRCQREAHAILFEACHEAFEGLLYGNGTRVRVYSYENPPIREVRIGAHTEPGVQSDLHYHWKVDVRTEDTRDGIAPPVQIVYAIAEARYNDLGAALDHLAKTLGPSLAAEDPTPPVLLRLTSQAARIVRAAVLELRDDDARLDHWKLDKDDVWDLYDRICDRAPLPDTASPARDSRESPPAP